MIVLTISSTKMSAEFLHEFKMTSRSLPRENTRSKVFSSFATTLWMWVANWQSMFEKALLASNLYVEHCCGTYLNWLCESSSRWFNFNQKSNVVLKDIGCARVSIVDWKVSSDGKRLSLPKYASWMHQ